MSDDDEQASVPSADESDDFASDASDSSKKKKSKPASKAPAKKAPAKPKTATAPKKPSEPKKPKKEPSSSVKPPKEASAGSLKAKASAAVTSASVNVSSDDITKGANVTTEAGAKKLISAYLHLQNRPYSAIQVFDNLHKRVPKGTTEKVLQSLADETDSGVRCKEFGKLKVFWSEQANLNLASLYTPEQMEALEERVEELKGEREAGAKREKTLMAELATLTEMPADEDLVRVTASLRKEAAEKRARLSSLSSVPVDPQAMRVAAAELAFYRQSWAKRKAQCMEAVDSLADSMEKKRKEVFAMLDVETDEDVGVVLPAPLK